MLPASRIGGTAPSGAGALGTNVAFPRMQHVDKSPRGYPSKEHGPVRLLLRYTGYTVSCRFAGNTA